MWNRLRESFRESIRKVRWFSSFFSERVKIEIAVFRMLYQSDEMNRRRDECLKTIGRRFLELRGDSEKSILKDRAIIEALEEVDKIERSVEELKQKASEISRVTT